MRFRSTGKQKASNGRNRPLRDESEPGDAVSLCGGRAVFMELGCHECHKVAGEDFPAPTADPPVPVALGGTVHEIRTDGYLVTSMIKPSHKLAGYPKDQVATEGKSRMPDETEAMTVRQLVDLGAYLQSRYKVVPAPHMYP